MAERGRWDMRIPRSVLALLALSSGAAWSKDNLASRPVALPDLELRQDLMMSQTEYYVETGKAYRLLIKSDPREDFSVRAPGFFQQVWINGVTIDGLTISTISPAGLQFDGGNGAAKILFVPIRLDKFSFGVRGYQTRGMVDDFVVE